MLISIININWIKLIIISIKINTFNWIFTIIKYTRKIHKHIRKYTKILKYISIHTRRNLNKYTYIHDTRNWGISHISDTVHSFYVYSCHTAGDKTFSISPIIWFQKIINAQIIEILNFSHFLL